MNNTSLGITKGEMLLAEDLRQIITTEHKLMATEIREMMNSAVWETVDDKFYKRREEYAQVYKYMQMHLL